jgi:hypothetical protein
MVGELSDHELLDACPGSSLIREGELEGGGPVHECSDPAHRALGREWTARDGRRICGEYHPPAHPSLVALRAA